MENTAVEALNNLSDSDFEKLLKEIEPYSKVGPTIEEYKEFLNRTPKI